MTYSLKSRSVRVGNDLSPSCLQRVALSRGRDLPLDLVQLSQQLDELRVRGRLGRRLSDHQLYSSLARRYHDCSRPFVAATAAAAVRAPVGGSAGEGVVRRAREVVAAARCCLGLGLCAVNFEVILQPLHPVLATPFLEV